ncbi:Sm-like ribonucleoprotein [Backusella circina FSU 941]|nr:Sm-like ribonucleoprotein [Backusella circina FSU 941]
MVANTENIKRLTSYLFINLRIKITDGRVFIGTFVCVDKEKNIILAQAEEFRGGNEKRLVGLVMIPGNHLVKVETEDMDVSSDLCT